MCRAALGDRPQTTFIRVSIITSVYMKKARHTGMKLLPWVTEWAVARNENVSYNSSSCPKALSSNSYLSRSRSGVRHISILQTFFLLEETQVRIMDLGQQFQCRCKFYQCMKGIIVKHVTINVPVLYLISVCSSRGLNNQAAEQKAGPWHQSLVV